MAATRRLGELAAIAGATIAGDPSLSIQRVSSVDEASTGALTVGVDGRWIARALASRASAVIVPAAAAGVQRGDKSLIVAADVRAALAAILQSFAPPLPRGPYTHPSAAIEDGVQRGEDVWIGAGAVVCGGGRRG